MAAPSGHKFGFTQSYGRSYGGIVPVFIEFTDWERQAERTYLDIGSIDKLVATCLQACNNLLVFMCVEITGAGSLKDSGNKKYVFFLYQSI